MLVQVNHDPATGAMTPELGAPIEGGSYAAVKGYQAGQDLFRGLQPERFDASQWLDLQNLWQAASFRVDDSGDGTQFVLFDAPMVRCENLIEQVDGYAVFVDDPVFAVPPVVASLTFSAGRFVYTTAAWNSRWNGGLDVTVNENGLNSEIVTDLHTGAWAELPFADGQTASQKAIDIGLVNLARQFLVAQGGYRRWFVAGDTATGISGFYDRVSLHYGPDGHFEDVDFANERGSGVFEPERDYDRRMAGQVLFPGQAELRSAARKDRLMAVALKKNREFNRTLSETFRQFGPPTPLTPVQLAAATGTRLAVGTPLWKKPMPIGGATETQPVMPAATTTDHQVFAGVVTRQRQLDSVTIPAQTTGRLLARVKGPVSVRDSLGLSAGHDYLVVGDGSADVGAALQSIPDTSVRLIAVAVSGGGGAKVVARWA
jgi:hypothetical protein